MAVSNVDFDDNDPFVVVVDVVVGCGGVGDK